MHPRAEGRVEIDATEPVAPQLRRLVENGRQLVRIFSDELTPEVFDDEELTAALSELARRNRRSEVRILIKDSRLLIGRSHHLASLAQRLPSLVRVRKLTYCPELYVANYLLVDDRGLWYDPRDDDKSSFINDDDRPMVKNLSLQFDELFAKSQADPELRSVGI